MFVSSVVLSTLLSYPAVSNIETSLKKNELVVTQQKRSFAARQRFNYENPPVKVPQYDEAYVGELQEKWRFPSDHLPVGVKVDGFEVVTWNVMNTVYMDWVYANSQGLSRSLLTEENYVIKENGLTFRDQHVAKDVLSMVNSGKSVIALQECSEAFIEELEENLPEHFSILYSSDIPLKDQNIILFDRNRFEWKEEMSQVAYDAYPCQPGRSLMNMVLTDKTTNRTYRFINVHVPGDPNLPGKYELAKYVYGQERPQDMTTIVLGDMNFTGKEMRRAFEDAEQDLRVEPSFQLYSSYWTNVGPNFEKNESFHRKTVDHIFIDNSSATLLEANEVLEGLQEMVDLLRDATEMSTGS